MQRFLFRTWFILTLIEDLFLSYVLYKTYFYLFKINDLLKQFFNVINKSIIRKKNKVGENYNFTM